MCKFGFGSFCENLADPSHSMNPRPQVPPGDKVADGYASHRINGIILVVKDEEGATDSQAHSSALATSCPAMFQ